MNHTASPSFLRTHSPTIPVFSAEELPQGPVPVEENELIHENFFPLFFSFIVVFCLGLVIFKCNERKKAIRNGQWAHEVAKKLLSKAPYRFGTLGYDKVSEKLLASDKDQELWELAERLGNFASLQAGSFYAPRRSIYDKVYVIECVDFWYTLNVMNSASDTSEEPETYRVNFGNGSVAAYWEVKNNGQVIRMGAHSSKKTVQALCDQVTETCDVSYSPMPV